MASKTAKNGLEAQKIGDGRNFQKKKRIKSIRFGIQSG